MLYKIANFSEIKLVIEQSKSKEMEINQMYPLVRRISIKDDENENN